ncbi:hypothetical protein U9K52_09890 [Chryseobacterium sp. MHB01]|uniref:hypothetical protein n=1 Tax=Chryseobacterium sp. MHB01 TaxID=3109433 RepID=UPI002AFE24FB|nr:hypothetical protein [Chryseobacterium sp. MHB01]MEA1849223.1 hypothetical protein [Chryseobacterium sp. MHB01]
MDKDLEQLLSEINFYQNSDVDYDNFDKIKGFDSMELGGKIEIFWKDREETDKGYIFNLPHQDSDEYDVCVHVTDVDNSEGMGDAPDEYHHLYHLVSLERIDKIEIL